MPDQPRDDRLPALVVVFGFSVGLGVGTVTIPLLALDAGYDPPSIGFLIALTAASQLGTRFALPTLLGRFSDRLLIAVAAVLMAAAFGLLLVSTVLPIFVAAQVLQGIARAVFWTSSQAHVVRGSSQAVRRLVDMNVVGNLGTMTGPALGGMLAVFGLGVSVAAAAIGATVAAVVSLVLRTHPPFDRRRSAGTTGLLRREGVDVACWASVMGGVWWSMVGSYIPLILVSAGLGSQGIGWLITASEAAGMLALFSLRGVPAPRVRGVVVIAAVVAGAMLIALAISPPTVLLYAGILIVGGAANGTVTTLAPALATLAAGEHEQGDALSLSGTFRAGALLSAPALVGALLALVAIPAAVVVVAVSALAPGTLLGRRRRRELEPA